MLAKRQTLLRERTGGCEEPQSEGIQCIEHLSTLPKESTENYLCNGLF